MNKRVKRSLTYERYEQGGDCGSVKVKSLCRSPVPCGLGIEFLYQTAFLFMFVRMRSAFKKTPVFDIESFQYPVLDLLAVLHQLRSLALLGFLVLARVVRDVHRDHEVRLLPFQTQQHEVNVHVLRHLAVGIGVWWRCLNEAQCIDWLVATKLLVAG